MSNGKPLTCLRCGAPIPSGFECAACAMPRPPQATSLHDDPPAEPVRSDGPKLALASLLALLMVGVLVFGGISGSASIGREKAEAARKEAAREARYAKEEADRKARVAQASQPTSTPSEPSSPPPEQSPVATYVPTPPPPGLYDPAPTAPQEDHSYECPHCHGAGQVEEDCDECDGEGQVVCDTCTYLARYTPKSGWGNFDEHHRRCSKCGGTSVAVRDFSGHDTYYYTCPTCHGAKKVTKKCYMCHGAGRLGG